MTPLRPLGRNYKNKRNMFQPHCKKKRKSVLHPPAVPLNGALLIAKVGNMGMLGDSCWTQTESRRP